MRTATAQSHFLQSQYLLRLACNLCLAATCATVAVTSSGCSLCQPGYLCDYAGVGGKWQRSDPENGRVGSVLSDPNGGVGYNAQPAEVIIDDGQTYENIQGGESIIEPGMNTSQATEEGVIILGDNW